MKVSIKRLDQTLALPMYKTKGSVGFDLMNREDAVIQPGHIAFLKLNVIIEIPAGQLLILIPRSSLPYKKGLSSPHGIGLIDQDFCGPDDEIRLEVLNFTPKPVSIKRGERVAQAFFVAFERVEWQEVSGIPKEHSRGRFGSTGGYHLSETKK